MSKPTGIHHGTLSWVKKELDETLKQAAEALEAYVQDPRDSAQLQFCGTHLHQVHGILQMLELFGASMLVEEMEQLVEALLRGRAGNRDDSYEVLMRAILQLSDYLERIQGGLQDIPILVLPLLNDLRAARGANLLTDNALFSPDLEPESRTPRHARLGRAPLPETARKLRHRYQLGLLGYLREQNVAQSLDQMLAVLDELDATSNDDQVGTLWWVASGLVEALGQNALTRSVAINSLLGEVDRQIKRVIDQGDEAFAISPPRELIKNLLYYVARAEPVGERVPAIQAHYNLKDHLLDESQLAQAREGLSGPNAEILQTVADAIKEDLAGAKDAIDLFVRGGSQDLERLGSVSEVLRRIADTLGVLGLGVPRTALREQAALVETMCRDQQPVSENQLLKLAETLLYVESALDGLIKRPGAVQSDSGFSEDAAQPEERELFELEYQQVFGNVINEAISDVGRIKESIVKFIETGAGDELAVLEPRFAGVLGALRILEMRRAAQLLEAAGRYVNDRLAPGRAVPPADELDALADTITGIEYYLEAARERRPQPEAILDVAASGLERLGYSPQAESMDAAQPDVPAEDSGVGEELPEFTIELEPLSDEAAQPQVEAVEVEATAAEQPAQGPAEEPVAAAPAPSAPEPAPAPAPAPVKKSGRINYDVPLVGNDLDPDILEIFVEEAGEVLQTLQSEFARWRANHDDTAALTTCRRMFHTLKGSGRLAGALVLGELAWSQENMLNRVLDQTIQPTQDLYETIEQTLGVLPALIANIEGGPAPELEPIFAIMRRAELLADPSLRDQPVETVEASAAVGAAEAAETVEAVEVAEAAELSDAVEATEPAEAVEPVEAVEFEAADIASDEIVLEAGEPAAEADDHLIDVDLALPALELEVPSTPAEAGLEETIELDGLELPELELEPIEGQTEEIEIESVVPPSDEIEFEAIELEPIAAQSEEAELEPAAPPSEEIQLEPIAAQPEEIEFESTVAPSQEVQFEPVVADSEEVELEAISAQSDEIEVEPVATEPEDVSVPAMDPVLYDIFSREAADHLAVVESFVAEAHQHGDVWEVTEPVIRALHTLSGSARMAGVEPIALAARKLELYAEEHLIEDRPFVARDLALLEQGIDLIRRIVQLLAEPAPSLPDVSPLLDAVNALRDEKSRTPPPVVEPIVTAPVSPMPRPTLDTTDVDSDLVNLFLEEADDILQFLESTVQRWEEEPDHDGAIAELHRSLHTLKGGARLAGFHAIGTLCHALEGLTGDVVEHKVPADDSFFDALHAALDQLAVMLAEAKAGGMPEASDALTQQIAALRGASAAAPAPSLPDTGADTELMQVFLDEASEILESTESILQSWQDDPSNQELVNELQRALHTLKGGARMAGFIPIGNLSHALETLLVKLLADAQAPDAELFELMERVHDRLFTLRAKAAAGEALAEATDLLQAIDALRSAAPSAAEAAPQPVKSVDARPEAGEVIEVRDDGRTQQGAVRVRADLLDNLVNFAGEVSIYRARLDQQVGAMRFNLQELDQTVSRLRDQLRTMEIETEAQMLYRFEREREVEGIDRHQDFDPLEFDRFSRMQELSRALSESVNDLVSIQGLLDGLAREAETLLLQQSRVNTELQDGLMRTRMVPFANLVPRMRRIVRQTCHELNKQAQFKVLGAQGEMDRTVLERVIPPLEHMLRNAVAHGIESPEARLAAGKSAEGAITVSLAREGADVVIRVADDGAGINLAAIRRKAIERGLIPENAPLSDRDVMQFILESGFTTAESVTQIAGRGVGMDVVATEIKQLGGSLEIDSVPGQGATFTVRLPFTLAINQALLCQAGDEAYAIPLTSIEGVVRMTHEELEHCFQNPHLAYYDYAGSRYEVKSLAQLLGTGEPTLPGPGKRAPVVLMQTGDHRLAIHVDSLLGNREIVVKSVGPQISSVPGIYGATILADGRVVLILDLSTLVRLGAASQLATEAETEGAAAGTASADGADRATPVVMVVDDSITMRKVATRLLERNGYQAVSAKDGVDAVARLQEVLPDAMLLDIEMPRMDGYELATHMRNDPRLRNVPIIMITSRTGEKHRQRAMEIGVDRYLGKPYQESDLLQNLREVLEERRGSN